MGVAFGYRYARREREAALIAHATVHTVATLAARA